MLLVLGGSWLLVHVSVYLVGCVIGCVVAVPVNGLLEPFHKLVISPPAVPLAGVGEILQLMPFAMPGMFQDSVDEPPRRTRVAVKELALSVGTDGVDGTHAEPLNA